VPATLTTRVTANPNPALAGEAVTFTITIRGPGVLSVESAAFGDGGTTGANAGEVPCGQTSSFDVTHTWTYVYKTAGTYQFRDDVGAIGPPPLCRSEETVATTTVVVSAPLQTAIPNGSFVSPSKNIACAIEPTAPQPVRCATFSPPQLAMMDATGSVSTCFGSQCELGNPGPGATVLPYGSATSSGPYQCVSSTSGMTCTVAGGTVGTGFEISRAGITRLS